MLFSTISRPFPWTSSQSAKGRPWIPMSVCQGLESVSPALTNQSIFAYSALTCDLIPREWLCMNLVILQLDQCEQEQIKDILVKDKLVDLEPRQHLVSFQTHYKAVSLGVYYSLGDGHSCDVWFVRP
jgi:hypothetical protein